MWLNRASKIEKKVDALIPIDTLIKQKQYSAALANIDRGITSEEGIINQHTVRARVQVRKAYCLAQLHRETEARAELTRAIIDFSRIGVTEDLEGDVIQAIELLVRNKETLHFLDDNYALELNYGSPHAKRNAHATNSLARAVWQIFDSSNSSWKVQSKLLELEKPRALKASNIARARYYFICARVEPTNSKREELGRVAGDLFMQANERWFAASSLFLASTGCESSKKRENLLNRATICIEPLAKKTEFQEWQKVLVADFAESLRATDNYSATLSFCRTWLNVAKAHPLDMSEVIQAYCEALRKSGQASEVKTFLLKELAKTKPRKNLLYAIFQAAQGDFNYYTGNASDALKAYLEAESIYSDDSTAATSGVTSTTIQLSWSRRRNLVAILNCSAYLDDRKLFDRFLLDAEQVLSTESADVIKLDEMLRRQEYTEIKNWVKIHPGAYSEDRAFLSQRRVIGTFAWDCVRIGDIATAMEVLPKFPASEAPIYSLLARTVAADKEQTKQLLDELQNGQGKLHADKESVRTIVTICHLLLNEKDDVLERTLKSQASESDHKSLVERLVLSREGRVAEALAPDEVDNAVATCGTSRVYETILMARVANASGRKADVPVYLAAAKKEMLRLFPPDHPAVKRMDEKIANSTP